VSGPVVFGTFTVNSILATGDGALPFPDLFNTSSINTSSSTAGVLDVWVTIQGLTAPVGTLLPFQSSFTSNVLAGSITSVQMLTFLDAGNGLFTGTPLNSHTFTAIGTNVGSNTATTSAAFSITEEFIVTASGTGSASSTIDVAAVPEPATWAMMLLGFVGLGFAFRQSRRKVSFA
jgi:hypothetical protein